MPVSIARFDQSTRKHRLHLPLRREATNLDKAEFRPWIPAAGNGWYTRLSAGYYFGTWMIMEEKRGTCKNFSQ